MLTAHAEVTDRIVGLELGADDYLPKPFEPRELVARIHNILRRSGDDGAMREIRPVNGIEVDPARREVKLDDAVLDLTTMEYELLVLFMQYPNKTFTRDELMNRLRGIDAELFSRAVDTLVSRLRHKLGDTSKTPRFIKTVWGRGYTFIGEQR
jgi:DNA-binding response OmpR family regulator